MRPTCPTIKSGRLLGIYPHPQDHIPGCNCPPLPPNAAEHPEDRCTYMANEPKTRTKNGKFTKGTSGNPSGRPAGSRNKATLVAEQLLDGESEQLIRKAVSLAKSGNVHALRLCLERVIPIRKERSIDLELPPAQTPQELAANYQRVLSAIGEGRITPGEAQVLTEI